MPRIKPLTENERKDNAVRGQLAKYQAELRKDNQTVAAYLGITPRTYTNRKNNPSSFTLEEQRRLKRLFPGIIIE
ncbi:MAG: hypothetical protein IIX10_04445 [Clostridia bacterium]|jgi:uncharacterized protein (DUF2384 family)|nr:hypothetical protein [Clostridia bacterium]